MSTRAKEPSPVGDMADSLGHVLRRYSRVYTIISPPRCGSTAFARILWEHPQVGFYCHEPFEVTYYLRQGLDEVARNLAAPLALADLKRQPGDGNGQGLVIKEMPYQVGGHFSLLASLSAKPLIFLMRDPRLSIGSRMAKKREAGEDPLFPRIETGWELWAEQIRWCRTRGLDHLLLDAADYRDRPLEVLPTVFERIGLRFEPGMLRWRACPDIDIDNLGGRHRHLYRRALESTGIKADDTPIPPLSSFPEADGWREHVARCLTIYDEFGRAAERIRPVNRPKKGPGPFSR